MSEKRRPEDELVDELKKSRMEAKANVGIDAAGAGAGSEVGRVTFSKSSSREFVEKETNTSVDFIISAHGNVKSKDMITLPDDFVVYSFTNLRSISQSFCCPNGYAEGGACQSDVTQRKDINVYETGNKIYNIYYSIDEQEDFVSGVYDCEAEDFLEIDIDNKNLLEILKELKSYTYNRPIRVLNLTCSVVQHCRPVKEKIVDIKNVKGELIKSEITLFNLYRKLLSEGNYKDINIILESLAAFFVDYYKTIIKNHRAFNLNYKETVTICNSINKWVKWKLANSKPEEDVSLIAGEYITELAKVECMRTAGVLLNAIIGLNRWNIVNYKNFQTLRKIAEVLVTDTEETSLELSRLENLPETTQRIISNISYYRSLIVNIQKYADIRTKLVTIKNQISNLPNALYEKHKSELQVIAKKHLEIDTWYTTVANTSQLVNISQFNVKLNELTELQTQMDTFKPAVVGATRRQLRPVKKRTKTIRRRNK